MNKLIIPLAFFGLCAIQAQASASQQVSFPGGDAAWTVKVEYPETNQETPDAHGGNLPKVVEIVRKGNLRRDRTQWTDGTTTETWWVLSPAIVLLHAKPSEPAFPINPGHLGALRFDEANFEWINASTFHGLAGSDTKPVRIYKVRSEHDAIVKELYAEIDATTGRPLVWSDGRMTATFDFHTPPAEPLNMPDKYHTELARIAERIAPAKPMGKR